MERYPGKQLFIDDYFIESLAGAHRVLKQPRKLTVDEPLEIPLDRPWEADHVQFAGVNYDERRRAFRLYYRSWIDGRELLCALDSGDGIEWERPNLGLVEWDGDRDNNITNCPPGGLSIMWDPHEQDEACRWKRIDNKPTGAGPGGEPVWRGFHSRDGYDWRPYPSGAHSGQPMLFNFGSPAESFGGIINPQARYVYYSQRGSDRRTRVLGRRDSRDFLNWSGLRTVIDQDLEDPPGTEFYAASFDMANRTEGGLHVLMLHAFLTDLAEPYAIVDASAGQLRYELLEDTGEPVPGCGVEDCDPIGADTLDGVLSWNGVPGWPGVSDARRNRCPGMSPAEFYVKLRFHIYPGTRLYSVTLDPPEVAMWRVAVPGRVD